MKIVKTILIYLISIFFLVVGTITIIMEEPWYGISLLLIGLLLLPVTSKLFTKLFPKWITRRNKLIAVSLIGLLILINVFSFGRHDYGVAEEITSEALSELSIHPIKKTHVNELDYYYIEKGEGDPILLLHGFPDMANTWDETITELSKTNRVIAPFLRGYYPTAIPKNDDYSVKSIAQDMVSLIDKLAIEELSVVGQDWGASIGFSVTNLLDSRVTKFVSIAIPHTTCLELTPKLAFAGRHFLLLGSGSYGVRYTRKNNFEYIDRLYQRWSPDYIGWEASSNAIKETFKYPNRTEAATGYYRSFASDQDDKKVQDFYSQIPQTPLLFLVGEHDLIYTESVLSAMRKKMPADSKVVSFKNAGHFLHREVFDEYIVELKKFLNIGGNSTKGISN